MAYSESLAGRIRDALVRNRRIEEKKMFGAIAFLWNGNVLVGVWKDSLIVRLSAEDGAEALREPHVRVFDITGRPMKGWILVDPDGLEFDDALKGWIARAQRFVETRPAKE